MSPSEYQDAFRSPHLPRGTRSAASREVTAPLRVSQRESYRLFGSPVPPRCRLRSPSRFSDPRLSPQSKECGSSSHRLQLFYRDPFRHRPFQRRHRSTFAFWSSSHEVLRPSSVQTPVIRHLPRFHPQRHPPRPFSDPRGFPSPAPAALFHATAAHRVSSLQSFSLPKNSTELVTRRYPLGVSPFPPKSSRPRPQGFVSSASPLLAREYCIPHLPDALTGFSAHTAIDVPDWSRLSAPHPPMTFPSRAFELTRDAGLRRFPSEPPSISRSHGR